jgi:hypothetical protein
MTKIKVVTSKLETAFILTVSVLAFAGIARAIYLTFGG